MAWVDTAKSCCPAGVKRSHRAHQLAIQLSQIDGPISRREFLILNNVTLDDLDAIDELKEQGAWTHVGGKTHRPNLLPLPPDPFYDHTACVKAYTPGQGLRGLKNEGTGWARLKVAKEGSPRGVKRANSGF